MLTKKMWAFVPYITILCITFANPVSGWLFTYEDGVYENGKLRLILYIVNVLYIAFAALYVTVYYKYYNARLRILVYVICCINAVPFVIQYYFPDTLVSGIALAITLLTLILLMDKHENVVDTNTGMFRNSMFADSIKRLIFSNVPFDVIMVRIVGFDVLSKTYGVGNALTMSNQVALKLSTYCKKELGFKTSDDTVIIIRRSRKYSESPYDLANRIMVDMGNSIKVNSINMSFEIAISIASFPDNVKTIDNVRICRSRFETMKLTRPGIIPFEELNIEEILREVDITTAIERGLTNGYFELYYQPICTAVNQKFVTAEALLRLRDPELGNVPPTEFIPVAEKNGTIIEIGNFVLEEVCRFVSQNNMEQLGLQYIEINLSAVQCMLPDFSEMVENMLEKYDVDPKYIGLEITETVAASTPKAFMSNLEYLAERGFTLILDDYGTGYSNFQRLVNSKFAVIKLDRDVTLQMTSNEHMREVYVKMMNMIHSMGCMTVSEGVETKDQYEFVTGMGCDFIQGWYFSKALPKGDFIDFIVNNR